MYRANLIPAPGDERVARTAQAFSIDEGNAAPFGLRFLQLEEVSLIAGFLAQYQSAIAGYILEITCAVKRPVPGD
jgi:hypothetical protein